MKLYFGYIRVSTAKQGEQGVSLQEQRDAIVRYAKKNNLEIGNWFEERETAAKQGRPVFNQMLRLIAKGKAVGVIIHKIDRSARNLRDWAELTEPIGYGIDVRFADGDVDLNTRGGRLVADMKAVVAADYIRNLRDEVKKGFYGRLKQGLSPLPAPIGYLDMGQGKPKRPDPIKAPLIRQAFELYSTGRFTIDDLVEELDLKGLRSKTGGRVVANSLTNLLHNPFYTGLIRLRRSGEMYDGIHEPVISKSLFDEVQAVFKGRLYKRPVKRDLLFRRTLSCSHCARSLIGEVQKGHVYYRCQSRQGCPMTCVREEAVEEILLDQLQRLEFLDGELPYVESRLPRLAHNWKETEEASERSFGLRLQQIRDRIGRLTDALVDGNLDKATFEERKATLLMDRKDIEETIAKANENRRFLPDRLADLLELARRAYLLYKVGNVDEKRDLVKIVTSNREVNGKSVVFTLSEPFLQMANRFQDSCGGSRHGPARTWERLFDYLVKWLEANPNVNWKTKPQLPLASADRFGHRFGSPTRHLYLGASSPSLPVA